MQVVRSLNQANSKYRDNRQLIYRKRLRLRSLFSVFVFVEEEIVFGWVIGPYLFDAFIRFAFVFELLEVLDPPARLDRPLGERNAALVEEVARGDAGRAVLR